MMLASAYMTHVKVPRNIHAGIQNLAGGLILGAGNFYLYPNFDKGMH